MAILPLVLVPQPVLRQVAEPVDEVTDELVKLADDMAETMYDAPGIGLAANQIGVLKRVIVMDCAREDAPLRCGKCSTRKLSGDLMRRPKWKKGVCLSPVIMPK